MEFNILNEKDMMDNGDEIVSNSLIQGNSIELLKKIKKNSVHLLLSDIPYGIGLDNWDVLHSNTNSAYMGNSPSQIKAGKIFKHRGKPLNGWSKADKKIPIEYYNWCLSWAKEVYKIMIPGSSVFIFCGRRYSHRCISAFEDCGFIFKDMIAWEKDRAIYKAQRVSKVYERRKDIKNANNWKGWRLGNLRPLFEPILWFTKPYKIGSTISDNLIVYKVGAFNEESLVKYNKNISNIFKTKKTKEDSGLHEAQKPIDLMKLLIELTTLEGQIVLDPFCGSGSTLLAAKKLGRKFIGIELDEKYFNIAKNRIMGDSYGKQNCNIL